ncbi:hypothetical protein [Cupriavidus sp. CuC1]|uniref:hypothetical protein n=1 Tax=Cupriavidus sp. CuC1 TaxID=3373131 RepID=UPI0037D17C2D
MSIEKYRGYVIEGFAKPLGSGEFTALGRVSMDRRVIEESDALGLYTTREEAQRHGILWAQKYVDRLDGSH